MTQPHISFATLADLAENRIPTREQTETLAHLSRCPDCETQLTHLRRIIEMMHTSRIVNVPRHLDDFVLHLFRSRIAKSSPLLQRIQAALSFDSLQMAPAFGLRAAHSTARQLIFSTEDHDLDLCITSSGKSLIISGQLLGRAEKGAIELRGERGKFQTNLNDSMEFSLPAVPAGTYELILHLRDIEIAILDLQL